MGLWQRSSLQILGTAEILDCIPFDKTKCKDTFKYHRVQESQSLRQLFHQVSVFDTSLQLDCKCSLVIGCGSQQCVNSTGLNAPPFVIWWAYGGLRGSCRI